MTWKTWNKFRSLLGHTNTKVGIALELTSELPSDERLLDMWLAEPVRTLIIPAHVFVSNAKGHPVLTKPHQNFVKKLIHKLEPDIILHSPSVELYPSATDASFSQYIQYLYRHLPEPDEIEKFASGYFDSLQMPLQPLADNLENQTYEIFEKDPIKYQQYERVSSLLKKDGNAKHYIILQFRQSIRLYWIVLNINRIGSRKSVTSGM